MPSIYSCHDAAAVISSKKTKIVPFVSQRLPWDCGLACVAMLCTYALPRTFSVDRSYDLVCQLILRRFPWIGAQVDEKSINGVWTIHLALLLRTAISSNIEREDGEPSTTTAASLETDPDSVQVSMFTTCVGVNPNHKSESYYSASLATEEPHVVEAFQGASKEGVQVQEIKMTTKDIVEMMTEEDGDEILFMCLVDANKLGCVCRWGEQRSKTWTETAWSWLGYDVERTYVGHYVVVCGYDPTTNKVLYRDPAHGKWSLSEVSAPSAATAAPAAAGTTDDDVDLGASGDESREKEDNGSGWMCACSLDLFEQARASNGTDFDVIMLRICS